MGRQCTGWRRWTDEDVEYLRSVYPLVGWREASVMLGRTGEAVMSKAKNMGIKSFVHDNLKNIARAYRSVDQHYFDDLSGYDKGYVLGFILADGSSNGRNLVVVEVKRDDEDVLSFISQQLRLTSSIMYRKTRPTASISIPTTAMNEKLRTFGIVPNKSSTIEFPVVGDIDFRRGVLCGYFDGDGSIGIRGRRRRFFVNFTSNSSNFLESISCLITETVGIPKKLQLLS